MISYSTAQRSARCMISANVAFSATPASKTPQGIATKLGVRIYIEDSTSTSKYGSDGAAWVVSAHA